MAELTYVNNAKAKPVDGLEKVLGTAKYVGDIQLPGMLYARVLRSQIPHGKITRLDVSPALEVPGVKAVITSADFHENGAFGWPVKDAFVLAYQKVRYVGDAIAAVAATTEEAANAGIRAIFCELEPLPVISNYEDALMPNAPLVPLEPNLEGNLVTTHLVRNGEPLPVIASSAKTMARTYTFAHQEHAYLETEGAVAIPEADGGVTIFANDQSLFVNRDNASMVLGLESEKVRVIQPPVGGSFGGKDDIGYQTTAQAAKLALITQQPVQLVLGREESMAASYKREAMQISINLGADSAGNLTSAHADILADSGAYASMTPLSAWRATMHAAGAYRYQSATVDTKVVYTNNGYSGAFRGFGNTQAAAASEMIIDELAFSFDMDPIDFRLQNCLKTGDHAFTGNQISHEVTLTRCLEWVREKSGWDGKRKLYPERNLNQAVKKGIGVANYFHGAGLGGEGVDYARIILSIQPDHSISLKAGLTDYGQGSRTVFSLLAAEYLGVSLDRIQMPRPDTHTALESGPTVASRASIVGGNAVRVAAEKLGSLLNLAAGNAFGCTAEEVRRFGEKFISPDEEEMSFEQVVKQAEEMGLQLSVQGYWEIPRIHWDFDKGTGIPYFAYSYGAQAVEVEVYMETGNVKVTDVWAVHDTGTVIFPLGAKGQFMGGITQGIGYALTEGFTYEKGIPTKLNFDTYHLPTSLDVPEMTVHFLDSQLPEGPFGARNLAEPVMIGTTPAIANAIFHATGTRIYNFPIDRTLLIR